MENSNIVSILMPVYNEEKYVFNAIDSILNQKCDFPIEICIVDDFSTDDTYKRIKEKYKLNKQIKLFKNKEKGKNNAFNLAFQQSKGSYIALLAGDDLLPDNALNLRARPLMDSDTIVISICKLRTFSTIKKFDGVVTPRAKDKGSLSGGCMVMKREFALEAFPIPVVLGNEDMWLVEHAQQFYSDKILHVPKVGILYRIHSNNSSSRTDPFSKKNKSMHHRFIIYSVFLERYREKLTTNSIKRLSALAVSETLRYQGDTLSLLFMSNLTVPSKIRMIMHSNKILYWIRIQLFSLLSGRG